MTALLNQALGQLNLVPGQSLRTTVNGLEMEVRVLPKASGKPPEVGEPEDRSALEDQVMLDPWFTFPKPDVLATVVVAPGMLPPPDPIILPREYEVSE